MPQKSPYSATVRTRPRRNGTVAYDVRYRLDGASRSISFETPVAAERWAKILRQIGPIEARNLLKLDVQGLPTVAEFCEAYITARVGVEGRTLDRYRTYLAKSIGPAFGELPLDAVTQARVQAWVNQQAEEGSAEKTIKNRHGFLAAVFKYAIRAELLSKSPCEDTIFPRTERGEMIFMSWDEIGQLLTFIPDRYRPLIATLALTGMRFSEATALRPGDVDLTSGTIRIARAWKYAKGRGNYVGAPKTDKSRRTISIAPDLVAVLAPLVHKRGEYLFVTEKGGPIFQSYFFKDVWSPARRLANGLPAYDRPTRTASTWAIEPAPKPLGKMPRIHDLRHSHVALLLSGGIHISVVQARLGHESIKTTGDTYGHLTPDMLVAPVIAMEGKLALGS